MTGGRTRARFAALAATAAAFLAFATFAAPSAQAHDQLVSSTPAADAVLTTAPERVELVYTEEIVELGVIVEVVGFDGQNWVVGTPTVASTVVTVPLQPGMFEGAYELRWRVVSSDGHPIDGTSTFTVTHADEGTETPSPSSAPPATESAAPTALPSESPVAAPNGAVADDPPIGTMIAVGGVVLLILVAAALLVHYLVRRRGRSSGP